MNQVIGVVALCILIKMNVSKNNQGNERSDPKRHLISFFSATNQKENEGQSANNYEQEGCGGNA